jgi:hypothetical protein
LRNALGNPQWPWSITGRSRDNFTASQLVATCLCIWAQRQRECRHETANADCISDEKELMILH